MKLSPLVSIIIPTFNRKDLIGDCIDSVLSQTFDQWELIIVDDGSCDGTIELVRSYVERDNRIRLLKRETKPKGACKCRNIGLKESNGTYIIFHDSDDLLHPRCLSQRVIALDCDLDLDFVVSPSLVFRSNKDKPTKFLNFPYESDKSDLLRLLIHESPWWTSGPTWRKSFLIKHKLLWPEHYERWQDWRFNMEALKCNPNYARLELFDSYYRQHSTSITRSKFSDHWVEILTNDMLVQLEDMINQKLLSKAEAKIATLTLMVFIEKRNYYAKSRKLISNASFLSDKAKRECALRWGIKRILDFICFYRMRTFQEKILEALGLGLNRLSKV